MRHNFVFCFSSKGGLTQPVIGLTLKRLVCCRLRIVGKLPPQSPPPLYLSRADAGEQASGEEETANHKK